MFASSDRALEVRVGAVLGRSDRTPPGPAGRLGAGAGTSSRTAVTGGGQNSRTREPPDSGRGRYSRTSAVASGSRWLIHDTPTYLPGSGCLTGHDPAAAVV